MIAEFSFSKSILVENITLTLWALEELQKTKSLTRCFGDNTIYNKTVYYKEYFIRAFLEVYNGYSYLKNSLYLSNTTNSIELYCKQLGSSRDLQSFKLINSDADRIKVWGTTDYNQLCLDLSKKLSPTEVQSIIHSYFEFLAYENEKPDNHGLGTFFEHDNFIINASPHRAYCCALFEKNYRVYTGLKTEHEYVIKPITLEVFKNANNFYKKLYNSMSDQ